MVYGLSRISAQLFHIKQLSTLSKVLNLDKKDEGLVSRPQCHLTVAALRASRSSKGGKRNKGKSMTKMRLEPDSPGEVKVPANKLWGAQTQRSLEHFSIGKDLIPREMVTSYAILKKLQPTPTTTASGLGINNINSSFRLATRFSPGNIMTCFRYTCG